MSEGASSRKYFTRDPSSDSFEEFLRQKTAHGGKPQQALALRKQEDLATRFGINTF